MFFFVALFIINIIMCYKNKASDDDFLLIRETHFNYEFESFLQLTIYIFIPVSLNRQNINFSGFRKEFLVVHISVTKPEVICQKHLK